MLKKLAAILALILTLVLWTCSCTSSQNGVDCSGASRDEWLAILQSANDQVVGYFGDQPHDLEHAPPEIQAAAARIEEANAMLLCIHRRDHVLQNLLLLPVALPAAIAMQIYTGGRP